MNSYYLQNYLKQLPPFLQLFSIIVFGCVADKGFFGSPEDTCVLNESGACNFALAIGVLAFIICLAFLVKDVIMVVVDFSGSIIVCFTKFVYIVLTNIII